MATSDREVVYSHDRVRRLRVALRVAWVVGVLLAAMAVWLLVTVVPDEGEALPFSLVVVAAGGAVLAASAVALRLLPGRGRTARTASIVTGVLLLPCSILLGQVGFVVVLVGLSVLFLALIADDPEPGERR